ELAAAGYEVSSAYTMVKGRAKTKFVYRDALWHGADMFGTGVASFGHMSGYHIQNVDTWEKYIELVEKGELPLNRAFPTTPHDRLVREMILQLKTGRLDAAYFRDKFDVDVLTEFADGFRKLAEGGELTVTGQGVELTLQGLLHIDRLLPTFFDPRYVTSR